MFCFNIPRCNPTEAADIVFSKFNACAMLIYCFCFLAWTFNHKMSSLFLDVFVLFWGGEPAGKLQLNDFLLRNVVIKNGLLMLAHACSRFAHACSRFTHTLLTLCSRSQRFLLSPLGSFWVLTMIFKSEKTTPTCHSQPFAEAGLPHPCLSLRYVCATFLLSPKDSESTSYIMALWHVPL